jgi:phenylalanyl-tRNA synthetase alpha chain
MQELDKLVADALALFSGINDADALEQAKARYLGKTGALTEQLKGLGKLSAAERPAAGARINAAKQALEEALHAQRELIASQALEARLAEESIDVTLPGRGRGIGGLHPVSRTMERIEQLFRSIGFEVADGPEIETDFYNFTALNQPENHPARSMHDTFYLADGRHLLRTHTSPIQIRYMEQHQPPMRVIAPGRVYRVDSDATHSPMFHQGEGLWIDDPFPSVFLSVYRALGGNRHELWRRLAGGRRLRHGASQRAAQCQYRQRTLSGFCLRSRSRPPDDAALWCQRSAAVL